VVTVTGSGRVAADPLAGAQAARAVGSATLSGPVAGTQIDLPGVAAAARLAAVLNALAATVVSVPVATVTSVPAVAMSVPAVTVVSVPAGSSGATALEDPTEASALAGSSGATALEDPTEASALAGSSGASALEGLTAASALAGSSGASVPAGSTGATDLSVASAGSVLAGLTVRVVGNGQVAQVVIALRPLVALGARAAAQHRAPPCRGSLTASRKSSFPVRRASSLAACRWTWPPRWGATSSPPN